MQALVVEDRAEIRHALAEVLRQHGHEVVACADAETAWATWQADPFPLVLLDVGLPGMDGLALCRRLRAHPAGERSVVLTITGSVDPDDLAAVLASGADDYLTKPFTAEQLTVRFAVAERRAAERAERWRAERDLRDSQARLRLVNDIATVIVAGASVEQIVAGTVAQVSATFPDVRVAYSTIDERGQLTVVRSVEPPGMPSLTGLGADLTAAPDYLAALRRHEPVVVADIAEEVHLAPLAGALSAGATRALLDVPLRRTDRLVGLLCLDAAAPRAWSGHEVETLTAVADYLAIALKEAHAQEERRTSEARYRALIEQIPAVVYEDDRDEVGATVFIGPGIAALLGYTAGEYLADPELWARCLHPEDRERVLTEVARTNATGEPFRVEYRLFARDGREIWVRDEAARVGGEPGRPGRWQGILLDVTEQRRGEEALRREREFSDRLIASSFDGILAFDRACRYTVWNPAMERLLGLPATEALGRCAFDLFPFLREIGEDRAYLAALAGQHAASTDRPYRLPATGEEGYFAAHYAPLRDGSGEIVGGLAVVRDSTERKRIEAELAHRAGHDPLTGLPNRAQFAEHLDRALTTGAEPNGGVAVLFLDLDGFKAVNDALGHADGDALLVAVAERLRGCVRPGDAIARLGGDEFTVLLTGVAGLEEATHVADRMRRALAKPFAIGDREVAVTASVGIAVGAAGDGEERDLVREADAAMYRAKRAGDAPAAAIDPLPTAAS